jgi:hypothetical protein
VRPDSWLAILSCVTCLGGIVASGCFTPPYVESGDLLWHPDRVLAIPNLSHQGWQRVSVEDADVAFTRPGSGVIAVRVRCPVPKGDVPLRWEGRGLWLGVPRGDMERFHFDLDGYEAVNISAASDGLQLRTLTVRTDECSLDVVQVAPLASDHHQEFEGFLRGVRLRPEAS